MKMIGFFHEVDPAKSGGKGRNLVALYKASFPVPPGFIVTIDAYTRFRASGKKNMPPDIREMVSGYYRQLKQETGNQRVSVRSSASAEDLHGASFAGQYDTYLYVQSEHELIKRIEDCWQSLFSERAVLYRQRMQIPGEGLKMAVIVQTMIEAKSAGILFSTYSYPGKPSEKVMIVESNWGCGETVVSGKATPDRFIVSKQGSHTVLEKTPGDKELFLRGSESGPETKETTLVQRRDFSLKDHELRLLCEIGNKIERHFGGPQDIEWALDDSGKIHILQSRPITKRSATAP